MQTRVDLTFEAARAELKMYVKDKITWQGRGSPLHSHRAELELIERPAPVRSLCSYRQLSEIHARAATFHQSER